MTTEFVCAGRGGSCGRLLYTSERDYELGDKPEVEELVAAEGMPEAEVGAVVQCPDCGGPARVMVRGPNLVGDVPYTVYTPA